MPRIRTLLSGITTFALSINMFLCGGFSVAAIGRDLPYDPYYGYTPIRTVAELNAIRNDLDGKYYLANDILFTDEDFAEGGVCYNDGVGWIAIGDSESPFTGELDGKNHTISGLKIRYNGQRNQRSLFGRNDGILRAPEYTGGYFIGYHSHGRGLCGFYCDACRRKLWTSS